MRRLDPKRCAMLMNVISPHYPNQQIYHLTDGICDLHATLWEVTRQRGFEYELKTVGCDLSDLAEGHPSCRVAPLDLSTRHYNKMAKKYDAVFVTLDPATLESDVQNVLRKFFRIMKNAATLTLLIERGSPLAERIDAELEESYYTAVNHIDIFDDFDVVTARKLHGWGAYQVGF